MTFTIKHLGLDESIDILYLLNNYAFRPTPPMPDYDEFAERIRGRKGVDYYAIFENGQAQAICSAIMLRQNIRGQIIPMGGVANVATQPAARRKGYVRALMRHLYQLFNDEEIGVSCLYPFKEAFYQRLGYATLPQAKIIRFDPKILSHTLNIALDGAVELLSFNEGRQKYREFLENIQKDSHGMALFAFPQGNAARDNVYWLALAKQGEKIIGLMRYSLTGKIMDQLLSADDFLFSNSQGKFLLLNWIARHIDQATQVELTLNPNIHGETLFTDIRPEFEGKYVAPMARVTSVPSLDGFTCGNGTIHIQIADADCKWNNGTWRFASQDGQLSVTRSANPACKLSIQGLTGLVYGVYRPEELPLRGWGEIDKNSQAILESMFPPATPFLYATY